MMCCETNYPFSGSVKYHIETGGKLAVRLPGYSKKTRILANGDTIFMEEKEGYVYLGVKGGEELELEFDFAPKFVYANSKIPALSGMTALMRGPLVYCFEGIDNEGEILSLRLEDEAEAAVEIMTEGALAGTPVLKVKAVRNVQEEELYTTAKPRKEPFAATAVPYFMWGNRGKGQMRVWMPEA